MGQLNCIVGSSTLITISNLAVEPAVHALRYVIGTNAIGAAFRLLHLLLVSTATNKQLVGSYILTTPADI